MKRGVFVAIVLFVFLLLIGGAYLLLSGAPSSDGSGESESPVEVEGGPDAADEAEEAEAPEESLRWEPRGVGSVSGRLVEYGSERPVVGVEVSLEAGFPGPGERLTAVTGADGSFLFEGVTNFGGWILGADAPDPLRDLEMAGISVVEERETALGVVYLTPDFRVPGVVVDEQGDPVKGALVRVSRGQPAGTSIDLLRIIRELPAPYPVVDSATTDQDGRFELTQLPPGAYDFNVNAEGYQQNLTRGVLINPEAQNRELRFVLPHGFELEGQVVRKAGGSVEGIPIAVFPEPTQQAAFLQIDKRLGTTDEDGRFVVDGLGAGEYWVAATPPGEPIALLTGIQIPSRRTVEVLLEGDASLSGRVTNDAGTPLAGAAVFVGNVQRQPPMIGHAVTDAEGLYRIDGLKAGPLQMFMVTADGYGTYPDDFLKILTGQGGEMQLEPGDNTRDVIMGQGGVVRGVVLLSGTDQPVEGARVTAATPASFFGGTKSALTDAQGKFEITGLPVGTLMLLVAKDGHFQPGVTPMTMAMSLGRQMQRGEVGTDTGRGPTVVIEKPGFAVERELKLAVGSMVSGQVFNPEGEPLAGAQVSVELTSGGRGMMAQLGTFFPVADPRLTDAEGRFTISAPAPGQQAVIVAESQGYLKTKSEGFMAKPGSAVEGVEITMRAGGTIGGVVTDANGAPVAAATVKYVPAGEDVQNWSLRWSLRSAEPVTTGEDGTFVLTNVEAGPLLIQVDHQDHLSVSRRGIEVGEGARLDLDFQLPGGRTLSGVVVDVNGNPVAGAELNMGFKGPEPEGRDPYWRAPNDVITDPSGRFEVPGLLPGTWTLSAEAEGHADALPIEVDAGATEVKLALRQAFEISGWVRLSNGSPVTGVDVDAYRVVDENRSYEGDATTDANGAFVLRGLPQGTYTLSVGSGGFSFGGNDRDVVPTSKDDVAAGSSGVVLEVDDGLEIELRVTGPDGEALMAGFGSAMRIPTGENGDNQQLQRQGPVVDGNIRFEGLIPGRYRITVTDGDAAKGTVELEAGAQVGTVALLPTSKVSGQAFGPDGQLLKGGWVSVTSGGDSASGQVQQDGSFEITGVLPGRGTVVVASNVGGQWKRGTPTEIDVARGADVTGVRVEIPAE